MARTTVVATKDFEYDGQPVHQGEDVSMAPIDAAVYARQGFVSLLARPSYATKDRMAVPAAPVIVTPVQKPTRRRRRRVSA